MAIYTFYENMDNNEIHTLRWWKELYKFVCTTVPYEKWFDRMAAKTIELTSDENYHFVKNLFIGGFCDIEEGDAYVSEWTCLAKDKEGNEYKIFWRFAVIKGKEPKIEEWPWQDETSISKIERCL